MDFKINYILSNNPPSKIKSNIFSNYANNHHQISLNNYLYSIFGQIVVKGKIYTRDIGKQPKDAFRLKCGIQKSKTYSKPDRCKGKIRLSTSFFRVKLEHEKISLQSSLYVYETIEKHDNWCNKFVEQNVDFKNLDQIGKFNFCDAIGLENVHIIESVKNWFYKDCSKYIDYKKTNCSLFWCTFYFKLNDENQSNLTFKESINNLALLKKELKIVNENLSPQIIDQASVASSFSSNFTSPSELIEHEMRINKSFEALQEINKKLKNVYSQLKLVDENLNDRDEFKIDEKKPNLKNPFKLMADNNVKVINVVMNSIHKLIETNNRLVDLVNDLINKNGLKRDNVSVSNESSNQVLKYISEPKKTVFNEDLGQERVQKSLSIENLLKNINLIKID